MRQALRGELVKEQTLKVFTPLPFPVVAHNQKLEELLHFVSAAALLRKGSKTSHYKCSPAPPPVVAMVGLFWPPQTLIAAL